jgi:hypothetical protein
LDAECSGGVAERVARLREVSYLSPTARMRLAAILDRMDKR